MDKRQLKKGDAKNNIMGDIRKKPKMLLFWAVILLTSSVSETRSEFNAEEKIVHQFIQASEKALLEMMQEVKIQVWNYRTNVTEETEKKKLAKEVRAMSSSCCFLSLN